MDSMTTEAPRPAPSFPGFFAAADGRIFRSTPTGELVTATVLPDEPGRYLRVNVPTAERARRRVRVHTIVADAFLPPRPFPAAVVRHLNDDKLDNRADNLAWGSHGQNLRDAVENGRRAAGRSKCLDHVTVYRIRALAAVGVSVRAAARRVGLPEQTVGDVVRGRTYRHVPPVLRTDAAANQMSLPMAA